MMGRGKTLGCPPSSPAWAPTNPNRPAPPSLAYLPRRRKETVALPHCPQLPRRRHFRGLFPDLSGRFSWGAVRWGHRRRLRKAAALAAAAAAAPRRVQLRLESRPATHPPAPSRLGPRQDSLPPPRPSPFAFLLSNRDRLRLRGGGQEGGNQPQPVLAGTSSLGPLSCQPGP